MANYIILYTKTAVKDIEKLDNVSKKRLKKKLEEYIKDPLTHAKRLTDAKIGSFRWRIGNYRVIFDIDGQNIVVLRVGHRREIYRNP